MTLCNVHTLLTPRRRGSNSQPSGYESCAISLHHTCPVMWRTIAHKNIWSYQRLLAWGLALLGRKLKERASLTVTYYRVSPVECLNAGACARVARLCNVIKKLRPFLLKLCFFNPNDSNIARLSPDVVTFVASHAHKSHDCMIYIVCVDCFKLKSHFAPSGLWTSIFHVRVKVLVERISEWDAEFVGTHAWIESE